MGSTTQISVHEYLNTSYSPDCDFVDGEVRERNLGELDHALVQTLVAERFLRNLKDWGVVALVEQRVQVASTRFRIPDVTVLAHKARRESIISTPPLIAIEVLSKDDSLRSTQERIDDYLTFGVQNVWIIDPAMRRAYVCDRSGLHEPEGGVLAVSGTPIRIVLSELFQQAAEML